MIACDEYLQKFINFDERYLVPAELPKTLPEYWTHPHEPEATGIIKNLVENGRGIPRRLYKKAGWSHHTICLIDSDDLHEDWEYESIHLKTSEVIPLLPEGAHLVAVYDHEDGIYGDYLQKIPSETVEVLA